MTHGLWGHHWVHVRRNLLCCQALLFLVHTICNIMVLHTSWAPWRINMVPFDGAIGQYFNASKRLTPANKAACLLREEEMRPPADSPVCYFFETFSWLLSPPPPPHPHTHTGGTTPGNCFAPSPPPPHTLPISPHSVCKYSDNNRLCMMIWHDGKQTCSWIPKMDLWSQWISRQ